MAEALIAFGLAFGVMLLIVGGMSVGVMAGRKPITGSCGGLAGLGIDAECEICGGNPARCESNADTGSASAAEDLSYDAARPPSATALGKREL